MKIWLRTAVINAVRAIAQTAIATIGSAVVLKNVDWLLVLSASVMSGLLSVLTSLTVLPEYKKAAAEKKTDSEEEKQ